jgi:hypothetical protein
MHKFSFAIDLLLRKYKKNARHLAEACGYPEHKIYNWHRGQGEQPAPGHLIKLARAFGTSRKNVEENHLSLLHAHLQDDCIGPAAKYIGIEVMAKALPIVANARSIWPTLRRSENDLATIRKHIWYDVSLQNVIQEIAKPLHLKSIPKTQKEIEPK